MSYWNENFYMNENSFILLACWGQACFTCCTISSIFQLHSSPVRDAHCLLEKTKARVFELFLAPSPAVNEC